MSLLIECVTGSIKLMLAIATIIIPLLTVLEILKDTRLLQSFSNLLKPLVSFLKLPQEAALPMVIGTVFGITYGAGVILQSAEDGILSKRDFLLITLFFAVNHGIIEDTLLFSRIGAKGWLLISIRFVLSMALVCILGYVLEKKKLPQDSNPPKLSNQQ